MKHQFTIPRDRWCTSTIIRQASLPTEPKDGYVCCATGWLLHGTYGISLEDLFNMYSSTSIHFFDDKAGPWKFFRGLGVVYDKIYRYNDRKSWYHPSTEYSTTENALAYAEGELTKYFANHDIELTFVDTLDESETETETIS